jgi:hypothetical protein
MSQRRLLNKGGGDVFQILRQKLRKSSSKLFRMYTKANVDAHPEVMWKRSPVLRSLMKEKLEGRILANLLLLITMKSTEGEGGLGGRMLSVRNRLQSNRSRRWKEIAVVLRVRLFVSKVLHLHSGKRVDVVQKLLR